MIAVTLIGEMPQRAAHLGDFLSLRFKLRDMRQGQPFHIDAGALVVAPRFCQDPRH